MSESGFEVARAYAVVEPDAGDFAAQLDEQIGGLQVSVAVLPDSAALARFAGAVDDGIGDLTATVGVGADTATAEASVEDLLSEISSGRADLLVGADTGSALGQVQGLADEISGLGGNFDITASTGTASEGITALTDELDAIDGAGATARSALSSFDEEVAALQADADRLAGTLGHVATELGALGSEHAAGLAASGLGTLPVTVVPNAANFAEALDEETGGLTVAAKVVPDVSDFAAAVDEAVGGDGITIPVTADTSQAVEDLDALQAAEEAAAASASQLSAIGEEAAAADGGVETLYNGILSIGRAATQAEMEAVDALGSIRDAAATAVPADAITEPFAAIGSAAQGAESEVTSALGEADGSIETFLGGIYSLGTGADAAQHQVADSMGNARQSVADAASAMGSVDYSAASEGLAGVAGAAGDIADAAPAAGEAASGLSGVLGHLGSRLSYVAVDPFMWMYAAPVVIGAVATALTALSSAGDGYINMLTQQDQAVQYNISGYQKLASQLSQAASDYSASAKTASDSIKQSGADASAVFDYLSQQMSSASQQVTAEATNISTHLTTLEDTYGLTATQAEDLASAAGVSAQQLAGSGSAADQAMQKIEAYANANTSALGPVGQLDADMNTFSNDTLTATARLGGLDDAYNRLVGNFAGAQSAMLTVEQDFNNLVTGAQTAGATMTGTNTQSLALQQSFYGLIPAIEQTANSMVKQGDSTSQVTAYVQDQIDKLSGLTGGSQQASQAVQGLQQWEDRMRGSLDQTDQAVLQSASNLQDHFIKQLEDAGAKSSATKTDVDELTSSIVATGDKSTSTASARAQLIKDLENAGLTAYKATQLVDGFIKSIQNIPSSKTVSIVESATGTITINEAQGTATTQGPGGNTSIHSAGGGLIQGGSGHPRADDIHAMLSHGEYVVQAPAVAKYGTGFLDDVNAMHFAGGGYAGDLAGLGAFTGAQYSGLQSTFTAQMVALLEAAVAAGKSGGGTSGGKAPVIVNFNGTQMPTPEQSHALMMQLSAAVGMS